MCDENSSALAFQQRRTKAPESDDDEAPGNVLGAQIGAHARIGGSSSRGRTVGLCSRAPTVGSRSGANSGLQSRTRTRTRSRLARISAGECPNPSGGLEPQPGVPTRVFAAALGYSDVPVARSLDLHNRVPHPGQGRGHGRGPVVPVEPEVAGEAGGSGVRARGRCRGRVPHPGQGRGRGRGPVVPVEPEVAGEAGGSGVRGCGRCRGRVPHPGQGRGRGRGPVVPVEPEVAGEAGGSGVRGRGRFRGRGRPARAELLTGGSSSGALNGVPPSGPLTGGSSSIPPTGGTQSWTRTGGRLARLPAGECLNPSGEPEPQPGVDNLPTRVSAARGRGRRGVIVSTTTEPGPELPAATTEPEPELPAATTEPEPELPAATTEPEPELPAEVGGRGRGRGHGRATSAKIFRRFRLEFYA